MAQVTLTDGGDVVLTLTAREKQFLAMAKEEGASVGKLLETALNDWLESRIRDVFNTRVGRLGAQEQIDLLTKLGAAKPPRPGPPP
jgi:hypothetical protein